MKKLKNILQHNYIFYSLLLISIIFVFININFIKPKSKYNLSDDQVYGIVIDYKNIDNKSSILVKGKEKILVNYYDNINVSYGDFIHVKGSFNEPKNNNNFNLFDYKKYLLSNKINYYVKADEIKIIKKSNNLFYSFKNIILKRIEKCTKSKGYIKTFIFADKSFIDSDIYNKYQNLGISHLFAVSGMHVSLVSLVLLKILKKLNQKNKYIIVSIFLLLYLFITNFAISMIRATFQFILFFINKIFKLNINNSNLVILLFSLLLFINPYYIYNVGFLFSFSISFTLIKFNELITGNFIIKIFKTSILSFFVSMPILINNFFKVNFLSIFINIIYIPYVSYILFPLSLITTLFPYLDSILYNFIIFFEKATNIFYEIKNLTFATAKMNIILVIIYYVLFIYILKLNKNLFFKTFIMLVFIIFIINSRSITNNKFIFLDQTTPNMIQRISEIFERKPLISKKI